MSAAAIPRRVVTHGSILHAAGHPIIQSFELGEDWRWCYIDEAPV
jgi:hypothetical protein